MGVTLFVLLLFVVVCAVLGYKIIAAVPPLLHTPLMSGMNALSGITLLVALAALRTQEPGTFSWYVALAAIILAMINVAGGYWVTERMLRMFKSDNDGEDDK